MSTYLQGSTDYIPQIQPFVPDYNFYAANMRFKQTKHDAARKQLSTIYGSLLNAPLTRDDNMATRDAFFKAIEQDIHKMAGMDLSLQQNYEAAAGVFNQILDNDAFVKDMVWTKGYQQQVRRSQGFKNCVDIEKCGGGWWEGGDRLLSYQKEAFKNAAPEEALGMGSASYTPYQDITKMAMDIAKEADIDIEVDNVTGQWITTTKNGAAAVGILNNLLQGRIAKDPKVMEYYKAKAEVGRKDFIYSNMEEYGSYEAAEAAYIDEITPTIDKLYGKSEAIEDDIKTTQAEKEKVDAAIADSTPDQRSDLEKLREDMERQEEAYQDSLADAKEVDGHIDVARRNQRYTGDQVDRILASAHLGADVEQAATTLAYKNYKQTVKENPYGVEAVKQKNRILMEQLKHRNKLEQTQFEFDLEMYKDQLESSGGYENNTPRTVEGLPGATAIGEGGLDPNSEAAQQRGFNIYKDAHDNTLLDLSGNERHIIQETFHRTGKAADLGDVRAKKDYVRMVAQYGRALTKNQGFAGKGYGDEYTGSGKDDPLVSREDLVKMVKQMQAINQAPTLNQKYELAKQMNIDWNTVAGSQVDQIYRGTVEGFLNPDKAENKALRPHLRTVWDQTAQNRRAIKTNRFALENMDKWYAEEAKQVVLAAGQDTEMSQMDRDALASYINDKGHPVSEEQFVKNMKAKGYTEFAARSKYRSDVPEPGMGSQLAAGWDILWETGPFASGSDYVKDWKNYDPETKETVLGLANMSTRGIHDLWKETFSTYARPKGESGYYNLQGAGDWVSLGQNYDYVDPAKYRGIPQKGFVGFTQDALNDKEATFSFGGFSTSTPEEDNAAARKAMQTILHDFRTDFKGDNRPILDVTYLDTAGGDPDKVGLNIKVPEIYRKRYKGSEKNPGDLALTELTTDGITIYMDRGNTDNLFTEGMKKSGIEYAMDWAGQLDYNDFPEYHRDMKLTKDPGTGQYMLEGLWRDGLNDDGTPNWNYRKSYAGPLQDLNALDLEINDILRQHAAMNIAHDTEYKAKNK